MGNAGRGLTVAQGFSANPCRELESQLPTLLAVETPDNAIETTTSFVWVDDGIIHLQSTKGVPSTAETVADTFTAIQGLTNGVPKPVLDDVRGWPGADHGAWGAFVSNALSLFSAIAWIADAESAPQLGAFPETIDRLLVPFAIFTDEAEALRFLRGRES